MHRREAKQYKVMGIKPEATGNAQVQMGCDIKMDVT
jgi:hypothetical protein